MTYGTSRGDTVAALPVGESINPANPDRSHYAFGQGQIAYVLWKVNENRTRPTRVLTSYGGIPGWTLGTEIHLHHDQTGAYMGKYRIAGVVDFDTMETAGDVPNIKIKWQVCK